MPIGTSSIVDESTLALLLAEQVKTNEYLFTIIYVLLPLGIACFIVWKLCKWFKSTFIHL